MLKDVRRETQFGQQPARPGPAHFLDSPALSTGGLHPFQNSYGLAAVIPGEQDIPKHHYRKRPDHVEYDQPRHNPEMRRLHLRMQSGNTVMNLPLPEAELLVGRQSQV
jgi:hypothetical protein